MEDDGRKVCVDCNTLSPPTDSDYTLISQRHGWRLTRSTDAEGKRSAEWRCPQCFVKIREKLQPKK